MAYNMGCGSVQGPPFFDDSAPNPQFYSQEDQLDSQNTWINSIDPEFRNSGQNKYDNQDSPMSWHTQPQPLERFMFETERNFFTAAPMQQHSRGFPYGLNRPSAPVSSLPQAPRVRMSSPSLSYGPTSSSCDEKSPGPDSDWCGVQYSPQVQARDDYSIPHATSYLGQGFSDQWSDVSQTQCFSQPTGYPCVNLSQVQGFADPQEVTWDADEGYAAIEMKAEYAMQTDSRSIKVDSCPTDEGLGRSIKSEGSPQESGSTHQDIEIGSDMDADGEEEDMDQDIITAEAPSDTEYSPRSTRTRKRRASKTSPPPTVKRSRVIKASPKGKGQTFCKSCDHAPFKDVTALQRHVATSHTRAFVCVFAFAGCPATFASKNEWKRHVSSQHLNLSAWVCELGACCKSGKSGIKGSEFNRKDLFTQHLRRMHAPFAVKRQNKKNAEWEEKLKELQVSCLVVKRHPPTRLACPVQDCGVVFDGSTCWDERMEHVGKHLERAATTTGMNKVVVEQGDDDLLLGWALREGIIDTKIGGGFRLLLGGGTRAVADDADADAEGEDDI